MIAIYKCGDKVTTAKISRDEDEWARGNPAIKVFATRLHRGDMLKQVQYLRARILEVFPNFTGKL